MQLSKSRSDCLQINNVILLESIKVLKVNLSADNPRLKE